MSKPDLAQRLFRRLLARRPSFGVDIRNHVITTVPDRGWLACGFRDSRTLHEVTVIYSFIEGRFTAEFQPDTDEDVVLDAFTAEVEKAMAEEAT